MTVLTSDIEVSGLEPSVQQDFKTLLTIYEHRLFAYLYAIGKPRNSNQSGAVSFDCLMKDRLNLIVSHEKKRRAHVLETVCNAVDGSLRANIREQMKFNGAILDLGFDEIEIFKELGEELAASTTKSTSGKKKLSWFHSAKEPNARIVSLMQRIAFWADPRQVERDLSKIALQKVFDDSADTDSNSATVKKQYKILSSTVKCEIMSAFDEKELSGLIQKQQTLNREFDDEKKKSAAVTFQTTCEGTNYRTICSDPGVKVLFLAGRQTVDYVKHCPVLFDDFREIYSRFFAHCTVSDENGIIEWSDPLPPKFIYPLILSDHFATLGAPIPVKRSQTLPESLYSIRDGKIYIQNIFPPEIIGFFILSCANKTLNSPEEANDHPDAKIIYMARNDSTSRELVLDLSEGIQNITILGVSPGSEESVCIPNVYVGSRLTVNYTIEGTLSERNESEAKLHFEMEYRKVFDAPNRFILPKIVLCAGLPIPMTKEDGQMLCELDSVDLVESSHRIYTATVKVKLPKVVSKNVKMNLFFYDENNAYQLCDIRSV